MSTYYPISLLCHMDGNNNSTGIIDSSLYRHWLVTNGDARLVTGQKKFGESSCYFDGNGDYLSIDKSPSFDFSTTDFTIEFWIYLASNTQKTYATIMANGLPAWQNNCRYIMLTSSRLIRIGGNISGTPVDVVQSSVALSENIWYHVAFTRAGNNFAIYINGTQRGTGSNSNHMDFTQGVKTIIGTNLWDGANGYFYGYLDEIRIIKGVCAYTENFTPPSAPFDNPEYSNKLMVHYQSNYYFNGNFCIKGIASRLGVPGQYFVCLFDKKTKRIIESQWSNKDGEYEFRGFALIDKGYFIIEYDNDSESSLLNAAISDFVTPEPMP